MKYFNLAFIFMSSLLSMQLSTQKKEPSKKISVAIGMMQIIMNHSETQLQSIQKAPEKVLILRILTLQKEVCVVEVFYATMNIAVAKGSPVE